jgi:peptide/nickel transport system permease protein
MSRATATEDVPLSQRIAESPRPALLWVLVLAALVAVEFGALATALLDVLATLLEEAPLGDPGVGSLEAAANAATEIPTLLSREVIPNQGYRTSANGPWTGTFLGLEPKHAWLLRVTLVYAYAFAFLGWLLYGYQVFRKHYRYAEWTPRDDILARLRTHRWGQFGLVVVVSFFVLAIFAPALGPTTVDQNIQNPYANEIQYFDEDTGSVMTVPVGQANIQSASDGAGAPNVQPWEYDDFGRFHPFGTLPTPGKDLFTFLAAGSRISLFIALTAISLAGIIAAGFGLLTAYYKGLTDLAVVVTSDSVQSVPPLILLILVSVAFRGHWLQTIYNGALLIALAFAFTYWPALWRAVRGPAFQIAEREWIDAARSYGQRPRTTMRKHMLPYIAGYLIIYASLSIGGIIIATAALAFLGLGITAPTPEWGRAIDMGQRLVATDAGHVSLIPGILIVLVVTGFNALGDGVRDALDPQSEASGGSGDEIAAASGGGG